ncbi:MAG: DUF3662 domain-containing protein [Chloroflexi bacterium]|nr:DUF3662 domain-containing protein [Chloroflexota bacterium]
MSNRLAILEAQIEQLVEGTLSRLLAGRLQAREVAVRLARAMEDHALPGPGGARLAPSRYVVHLNPDDVAALQTASPELTQRLTDELVIFARELDLTLAAPPAVVIEANAEVELNGIRVDPAPAQPREPTQPMISMNTPLPAQRAPKAYLIVGGDRHLQLDRPVITLGRRLDNTVILDDPRVSRHHAQLRQRYGRWVLYDLGSAAGTSVNNDRVEECVLRPGDVISLAGVALIYGEEEPGGNPEDTGHTRPMQTRADARPKMKDELRRMKDE